MEIKNLEVKDNKYYLTVKQDDRVSSVIEFNQDEVLKLSNFLKAAIIQNKGVVQIAEDAVEEISIEEQMKDFRTDLMRQVKSELEHYQHSLGTLHSTVSRMASDKGLYEQINNKAVEKLANTEAILKQIEHINTVAGNSINKHNEDIEKAVNQVNDMSIDAQKSVELYKRMIDGQVDQLQNFNQSLQKMGNSINEIKTDVSNFKNETEGIIKKSVEKALEEIKNEYAQYINAKNVREELFKEFQKIESRKIMLSEHNKKSIDKKEKELKKAINKTNKMLKDIEKEKEVIKEISRFNKSLFKKKFDKIINEMKYAPDDIDRIIPEISKVLEQYEKKQSAIIREKEKSAINKIKKSINKESKIKSLQNKIKGIFGK